MIAKTPTDGGPASLILASALAAREGIPVTLVSDSGRELSRALVRAPEIGCVSFAGDRDTGAAVADGDVVPLHRADPAHARFLPGQDTSAYVQPLTFSTHPAHAMPDGQP